MNDHANLTDQPDHSVQNSSQVPEDHADVVTATAVHGEERVAPWVPFRVLRLSRPSFFMCPIIGSIALRRRRSLAIVPVDTTLRAALAREFSITSSRPSEKSATSSLQTNAAITSKPQDIYHE